MSDLIFPSLRGLTYPITKTPNWNTITQKSITGIQKKLQLYTYPNYNIKLVFEYLEDDTSEADDIRSLLGFYNRVGGAGQDFLFADEKFEPNSVTNQTFGVGDGTTTAFQLAKTYGGFTEPVFGLLMTPAIYINEVATTAFTWSTTGLITFTTAPNVNDVLKWTGYWYYRCYFKNDNADFEQMMQGYWDLQELELESIKL